MHVTGLIPKAVCHICGHATASDVESLVCIEPKRTKLCTFLRLLTNDFIKYFYLKTFDHSTGVSIAKQRYERKRQRQELYALNFNLELSVHPIVRIQ